MMTGGQVPTLVLVIFIIVCAILLVLDIVMFYKLSKQQRRLDIFMSRGVDASLRDSVIARYDQINALEQAAADNENRINDLYGKLAGMYQKTGIVKYDAFEENGGRLSFSLALLDDNNDGILINVMTGREGSYCYIKEISNGSCDITLGREEEEALRKAAANKR